MANLPNSFHVPPNQSKNITEWNGIRVNPRIRDLTPQKYREVPGITSPRQTKYIKKDVELYRHDEK